MLYKEQNELFNKKFNAAVLKASAEVKHEVEHKGFLNKGIHTA